MKLRTTLVLAAFAATVAVYAQFVGSKPVPADVKAGFDSIKIADLKNWLGYLAGPECEGRGAGQPGYQKAADYMAKHFKEFGLKPVGDDGTYFQYVRVSGDISPETSFTFSDQKVALGADFTVSGVRGPLKVSGPMVYLQAKGANAKVPAGATDKIVIAKLDGVSRDFRSALLKSAKLVVEVTDLISENRSFNSFGLGSSLGLRGRLSPAMEEAFVKKAGVTPKTELADNEIFMTGDLGSATLDLKVDNLKRSDPNVIGLLEGSDPKLKHEHVGIGGHLDHEGVRNGVVYWGADDDASGCSALLAIAKAMKINKLKPKRSILFMAFAGEESGLVGSRYIAEYPPLPLKDMICELQMDMVGRNSDGAQNGDRNRMDVAAENTDTMRLVGSQRIAMDLHRLILQQNEHVNFRFKYDAEDVYTRSDHYSFAAKGVPVAFQFSGFHPDYHQPTDTIEKINFEKVANAAKLYYLVALRAANRAEHFKRDVPQDNN